MRIGIKWEPLKPNDTKAKALAQAFSQLESGDQLLIQFPMLHHSFFTTSLVRKIQRRGVQVYFIIHDLEALRYANLDTVPLKHKIRVQLQESSLLKIADGLIAHNPIMKSFLVNKGISEQKIVSLGIFDYLIPDFQEKEELSKDQPIIVAGNLAQEKAGYLYKLPANPAYNLYGVGFDESRALENETYFGSSYRMSFLQPLRVVLDWSGMGIVRKPVVVFLASTFATTTLTRRRFI